jgi:hypothetical protein
LNSDRYELETNVNKALGLYKISQNVAQAARDAGVSLERVPVVTRHDSVLSQKFSLLLYKFS